MVSKVIYRVTGIRASGEPRLITREFKGAPNEGKIAQWLRSGANNKDKYDFAVRYYPKYRGWRVIDLRQAFVRMSEAPRTPGAYPREIPPYWSGIAHFPKHYGTEDAAVMVAIHAMAILNSQPKLL